MLRETWHKPGERVTASITVPMPRNPKTGGRVTKPSSNAIPLHVIPQPVSGTRAILAASSDALSDFVS